MSEGTTLAETLTQLEGFRAELYARMKLSAGAIIIMTSAMAGFLLLTGHAGASLLAGALGLLVTLAVSSRHAGKVKRAFKRQVIPILLQGIDSSLRYDADRHIEEELFNQCSLYASPDRYSGKDLVEGYVGDTAVRFSLVHAEEEYEETHTDSDGNTHTETHYRTLFRGLLFIADFNKDFTSRTLVRPCAADFFSRHRATHVSLEDPEFNRLFSVRSKNQVEARYLLTPAMMERLKTLRAKVGKFHASFSRGHLFLALEMPWSAFEPSTTRSFLDSGDVQRISGNLRTITAIVADLGLNVRIWTKPAGRPPQQGSAA